MTADCPKELHEMRAALRFVACPTPSSKLVLMAVIDLGAEEYTQATLAAHTGFSLRQIGTLLKALEGAGLITRERRGGAGTGRLPDRYVVNAQTADCGNAKDLHIADTADCALPIAHCAEPETPRAASSRQSVPAAPEIPPYDNNSTPPLFDYLRSVVDEEGSGEDFDGEAEVPPPAPAGKRRTKNPGFYADEATMPLEPSARMLAYAGANQFFNGTVAAMHAKFRQHHIDDGTLIKNLERRWETWVDNQAKWRKRDEAAEGRAYTLPDGRIARDKKHGFVAS